MAAHNSRQEASKARRSRRGATFTRIDTVGGGRRAGEMSGSVDLVFVRLETLSGGHVVELDNPAGFADAVRSFLREL